MTTTAVQAGGYSGNPIPEEGWPTDAERERECIETNMLRVADFLEAWRPAGPWAVASILEGEFRGASFGPDQEADLVDWLIDNNDRSLYFAPNPLLELPASGKAKKEHVAAVVALHVDIDPRKGHDLQAERDRIIGLLTGQLPDGVPPPSVVIDSGGGFQAYWQLREPFEVNGDVEKVAEIESYTRWIEEQFDADRCHNVDRLMRLPLTINRPSAKKREAGRVDTPSSIVLWDENLCYDLADFKQAAPKVSARRVAPANVPDDHPFMESIDELPAGVSPRTRHLIEHGHAPGADRSDDVFAVCCDLLRNGVEVGLIFAILIDKRWPISKSVFKKGDHEAVRTASRVITAAREAVEQERRVLPARWKQPVGARPEGAEIETSDDRLRAYAMRDTEAREAAERAKREELFREFMGHKTTRRPEPKAYVAEEWIDYLNSRYAKVNSFGGKARIISFQNQDVDGLRRVLVAQSTEDLKLSYSHARVNQETTNRTMRHAVTFWLEDPRHRRYEEVFFDPSLPSGVVGSRLNLWQGFAVEPRPGDWSLMQRHIREVIAAGNDDHADYITKWLAWTVQNPGRPAEVALVFRGGQGTGKGTLGEAMRSIFGAHGLTISSNRLLVGNFNAHLRDCALLLCNEAFAPQDRAAVGVLKALLTDPTLAIEAKGVDVTLGKNCLHVMMTSNERWVVPADQDDRRFVVFDVSRDHQEDETWFRPLRREMGEGGLAAMLHDLLAMDLGGWHPRQNRPRTNAGVDQRVQSLRGIEKLWLECLQAGVLPSLKKEADGSVFIISERFLDWARERARGRGMSCIDIGPVQLAALLSKPKPSRYGEPGMGFEKSRGRVAGRGYWIPPLAEARARWNELRPGLQIEWDDADGWQHAE